jgi:hypothetical protein
MRKVGRHAEDKRNAGEKENLAEERAGMLK